MKTVVGIVLLVGIVGGIYLLNDMTRTEDGKSLLNVAGQLEILVETEPPQERGITRAVQAPGEVEAFDEVDISSEVVAKIIEMTVEEGDYVQAGQLLCRLDDADYKARVLSAEANVAKLRAMIIQAEADLEKTELDYNEQKRLIELGATSKETMAQYRTMLVGAQAVLEMRHQELIASEAALKSTQEDLAKTVIEAPLSGIISQRFAEPGEVVITGTMNNPGTRIMVVSDLSKMQVRCRVDEADASLVEAGQVARIYLQSDTHRSIPGHVLRVGTKGTKQLGRDVVTFETLVLITGTDERVKPGMTASVEIEVARRDDALTIPVQAVVHRKLRDLPAELAQRVEEKRAQQNLDERQLQAEYIKLVFCMEDGQASARLVETGINDINRVEIITGITTSDEVIIGPYRSLDLLKDGAAVKLKEEPTAPAATQPAEANVAETQPTTQAAEELPDTEPDEGE
ncbi:MAG: efflux RND transporter periplasmic adaptor subunit [Planctomycetota bacterium]